MTSKRSLLSVQKSASSVGGLASSGGLKSDVSDTQCRQAEPLPKRQRSSGHNKRTSLAEGMIESVCLGIFFVVELLCIGLYAMRSFFPCHLHRY